MCVFVCDRGSDQTHGSVLMKLCPQVIWRTISVELIDGSNCFDRFQIYVVMAIWISRTLENQTHLSESGKNYPIFGKLNFLYTFNKKMVANQRIVLDKIIQINYFCICTNLLNQDFMLLLKNYLNLLSWKPLYIPLYITRGFQLVLTLKSRVAQIFTLFLIFAINVRIRSNVRAP